MKNRAIVTAAMVALVGASALPRPLVAATLADPVGEVIRAVRTAFDDRLFDYPTARFRNVHANAAVVCGEVNAKNRYGAYIGWRGFYVLSSSLTVADDDPTSAESMLVLIVCPPGSAQGPDLSSRLVAPKP